MEPLSYVTTHDERLVHILAFVRVGHSPYECPRGGKRDVVVLPLLNLTFILKGYDFR
jgi:hypothetical protein